MTQPTPPNPTPPPTPPTVITGTPSGQVATPVVTNAPNKALAAALTTIIGVIVQWLGTGHFTFDQEGVTAIVGAVATILVYIVDNRKTLFTR